MDNSGKEDTHTDHGGEHPPFLAHHFESPQQQFDAGKLGMWIFLVTEILLFGGLFCAYAVYRAHHPEIFNYASEEFLDKTLGAVNTAVLIFSSFTMAWAVRCAQLSQRTWLVGLLSITLACGFVFLSVKYVEYKHKWEEGLLWARKYDPVHHEEEDEGEHEGEVEGDDEGNHEGGHGGASDEPSQAGSARETARAAQQELLGRLSRRLRDALAEGGPAAAIPICRQVAPQIAQEVGRQFGVSIGRTSFRLRNSENQPPEWALPMIEQRVEEPQFVDLPDGRLAALLPIRLQAQCTACHGAPDQLDAGVTSALTKQYPDDQATGFQDGDLRGWCWVEVPASEPPQEVAHEKPEGPTDNRPPSDDTQAPQNSEPLDVAGQTGTATDAEAAVPPEPTMPSQVVAEVATPSAIDAARADGPDEYRTEPKNVGVFFSIYFIMTGLHGLHVIAGMIAIGWVLVRSYKGHFTRDYYGPVDFVGLYWHLVDLVWIFLFPLLYLIA